MEKRNWKEINTAVIDKIDKYLEVWRTDNVELETTVSEITKVRHDLLIFKEYLMANIDKPLTLADIETKLDTKDEFIYVFSDELGGWNSHVGYSGAFVMLNPFPKKMWKNLYLDSLGIDTSDEDYGSIGLELERIRPAHKVPLTDEEQKEVEQAVKKNVDHQLKNVLDPEVTQNKSIMPFIWTTDINRWLPKKLRGNMPKMAEIYDLSEQLTEKYLKELGYGQKPKNSDPKKSVTEELDELSTLLKSFKKSSNPELESSDESEELEDYWTEPDSKYHIETVYGIDQEDEYPDGTKIIRYSLTPMGRGYSSLMSLTEKEASFLKGKEFPQDILIEGEYDENAKIINPEDVPETDVLKAKIAELANTIDWKNDRFHEIVRKIDDINPKNLKPGAKKQLDEIRSLAEFEYKRDQDWKHYVKWKTERF